MMFIKKFINFRSLIIFSAVLFIANGAALAADDQLSSVLDGVFKRYGGLKGISVPYKREIITKSMAMLGSEVKSDKATGKILFKPPQYLSIIQEFPAREDVITDGQTIWYYMAAKNTVYEYPADKFGNEVKLLSRILSGLGKVGDSFSVQPDQGDNKEYHLKLVPNPPWEDVDHIDLVIEKDSFNIRVVEINDLLGGITRFTLYPFSRKDLEKEDFSFKAPAGAKVIKEQ
jgi:outer membrane lipoprotein-sorting protein